MRLSLLHRLVLFELPLHLGVENIHLSLQAGSLVSSPFDLSKLAVKLPVHGLATLVPTAGIVEQVIPGDPLASVSMARGGLVVCLAHGAWPLPCHEPLSSARVSVLIRWMGGVGAV